MSLEPSEKDDIARLAYELWESRGHAPGSAEKDWLEAEAILAKRKRGAPANSLSADHAKPTTERRKSRSSKDTSPESRLAEFRDHGSKSP
jgi:hypothetical protein